MSEEYLIKWAEKVLTSTREWVECRQVWQTNGCVFLCCTVQCLLWGKWPSGHALVSRVTWVLPSSRFTCRYHWKQLSPLSPYFNASPLLLTSKTCNFVLFKSPLCFGFSFNNPGWPKNSISSYRIHSVNTKWNIDHGHDYSAWFLAFLSIFFFFCGAWTFLLTRRRRRPFDPIKALQIIYIFGTWDGFKLISASADADARSFGGWHTPNRKMSIV